MDSSGGVFAGTTGGMTLLEFRTNTERWFFAVIVVLVVLMLLMANEKLSQPNELWKKYWPFGKKDEVPASTGTTGTSSFSGRASDLTRRQVGM